MGNHRRPRPQHDPAYKQLQALLRAWREEAGLTQAELGEAFGRPHTFVHKCESGDRRVDPVEFVRWCRVCGMKPEKGIAKIAAQIRG